MIVTIITMCRLDAETYTQVVEGRLSPEQRSAWRKANDCDQDPQFEDQNNMFFRELEVQSNVALVELVNIDGDKE